MTGVSNKEICFISIVRAADAASKRRKVPGG